MSKKLPENEYKKMNLPLPREMHEAIFAESQGMGMPATRLVRMVMDNWLQERRRARRREKVREFAQAAAGTALDLDPELEAAGVEELKRFYEAEDDAR